MPTVYEARCLNCGNLGHYKAECPRTECRKCHSLGHTGSQCHVKLPPIKLDSKYKIDAEPVKEPTDFQEEEDEDVEEDHIEKFYAS